MTRATCRLQVLTPLRTEAAGPRGSGGGGRAAPGPILEALFPAASAASVRKRDKQYSSCGENSARLHVLLQGV